MNAQVPLGVGLPYQLEEGEGHIHHLLNNDVL